MSQPEHISTILPPVMEKIRQRMTEHKTAIVYADGAAEPTNPGPMAAAYILRDTEGNQIQAKGFALGHGTNNQAEYEAVIRGAEAAATWGATSLKVYTDSLLVVNQLTGKWRVKSENLKDSYDRASKALGAFADWDIQWLPREENVQADTVANAAIKYGDVDYGSREILGAPGDSRDNRRARRRSAEVLRSRRRVLAARW